MYRSQALVPVAWFFLRSRYTNPYPYPSSPITKSTPHASTISLVVSWFPALSASNSCTWMNPGKGRSPPSVIPSTPRSLLL